MEILIIILIIIILLYFYFVRRYNKKSNGIIEEPTIKKSNNFSDVEFKPNFQTQTKFISEILTDEEGLEYKIIEKEIEVKRHTYIKAELCGKYWGEKNVEISDKFEHSNFFEFNIYEVILQNAEYSEYPFNLKQDSKIPREKLPKLLNTILKKDGQEYILNLHEPKYANIRFSKKLHQDEGDQVFGTIQADITGYLIDFTTELVSEKIYIKKIENHTSDFFEHKSPTIKQFLPTGNVEFKGNYKRIEYHHSDFKNANWGDWEYSKTNSTNNRGGCINTIFGIISGIFCILFLLIMLPRLAILLPFALIFLIFRIIPQKIYRWIFKILTYLFLIGFLFSFFYFFGKQNFNIKKPNYIDDSNERGTQSTGIVDTLRNIKFSDTLIQHFRIWNDYSGNKYQGKIWVKKEDYKKSKFFKENLNVNSYNQNYDGVIHALKENDHNKLNGVYQLFDSIKIKSNLSPISFAEMIVSFVQDIPYALVVADECNPRLYDNKFIREYLNSENARCDGYEKFGINTPVEFMSNLNGDCDTRTLFLYTILAHYNYDVVLLSSEFYGHSIIGVNLPISGISYTFKNQKYVLWETTAPNFKPGIIPKDISNLKHWRISLKSN